MKFRQNKKLNKYISFLTKDKNLRIAERICNLYDDDIFAICFSVLKNINDANDAYQDVYVKICRNIKIFYKRNLEGETIHSLIKVISRNTAIDYYRKLERQYKKELLVDETIAYYDQYQENLFCEDKFGGLEKYTAILDAKSMYLLILYYYFGFSCKEIANIVNMTEANVYTKMHRIRIKVKEKGGELLI